LDDLETSLSNAHPDDPLADPFAEEEPGLPELLARVAKLETKAAVQRPTFAALEQRLEALEAWKKAQEDLAADVERLRREVGCYTVEPVIPTVGPGPL
jgi:uncharacterized coiled-coil protein SlyX